MTTSEYLKEKYGQGMPVKITGMNRQRLYELFRDLKFRVGAEVGLFRGRNASLMFRVIEELKLYGVEPFADEKYTTTDPKSMEHIAEMRKMISKRLEDKNVIIIEKFSEDAVKEIPYDSLDFVYIDGDHSYNYAMMDIILWSRRVRQGGIVSGHDYNYINKRQQKKRNVNVKGAVNNYMKANQIKNLYITDDKCSRRWGDKYSSWFFVKE